MVRGEAVVRGFTFGRDEMFRQCCAFRFSLVPAAAWAAGRDRGVVSSATWFSSSA